MLGGLVVWAASWAMPSRIFCFACGAPWCRVSRVAAYKVLARIGAARYGPSGSSAVQRLPFGLYLKSDVVPDVAKNEFNAMRVVCRHASIPIPKPLDLVVRRTGGESDPFPFDTYILMTRVPGQSLSGISEVLSDRDEEGIKSQIQGFIQQLRAITHRNASPTSAAFAVGNSLGGPVQDNRVRGGSPMGPFATEEAFSSILRYSDDPGRQGHDVVFTHADLNPPQHTHRPVQSARRNARLESEWSRGLGVCRLLPGVLGLHQVPV
jgi:hypothetical protein